MSEINWKVSKEDHDLICKIVDRAEALFNDSMNLDRMSTIMDITAVHANGCPLKLKELLKAGDFNFCHDVGGIIRNIDRKTGKLGNCFSPRFADMGRGR